MFQMFQDKKKEKKIKLTRQMKKQWIKSDIVFIVFLVSKREIESTTFLFRKCHFHDRTKLIWFCRIVLFQLIFVMFWRFIFFLCVVRFCQELWFSVCVLFVKLKKKQNRIILKRADKNNNNNSEREREVYIKLSFVGWSGDNHHHHHLLNQEKLIIKMSWNIHVVIGFCCCCCLIWFDLIWYDQCHRRKCQRKNGIKKNFWLMKKKKNF